MSDEHRRLLLAFFLSFLVLFIFQLYTTRSTPPHSPPPSSSPSPPSPITAPSSLPPPSLSSPPPSFPSFTLTHPTYSALLSGPSLTQWSLHHYRTTLNPESPEVSLCPKETPCARLGFVRNREILFPYEILSPSSTSPTITLRYPGEGEIRITSNPDYTLRIEFSTPDASALQPSITLYPLSEEPDLLSHLSLKLHRYGELSTVKGKELSNPLRIEGNPDWVAWDGKYFAIGVLFRDALYRGNLEIQGDPPLEGITLLFPPLQGTPLTLEFFGIPKEFRLIRTFPRELDRLLDFGWSGFLARPLASLLHFFYGILHNYGFAIILLTILVRLLLYPLTYKGFHSMQKLSQIRPKLEEIQKRYKDDPRRLQEELLKLYRTEKVNPFSGCLPLLLQLPVFIALYQVLLVSVELRHAPFGLWIRDLSSPDTLFTLRPFGLSLPFRPLPLAMGITTYLQQKLSPSPATLDPAQRMIMNIMPVFLTIISYGFPSGLVLYWFISNLFSIAQQWWMMRSLAPQEEKGSQ